jgi:hypothetical protein
MKTGASDQFAAKHADRLSAVGARDVDLLLVRYQWATTNQNSPIAGKPMRQLGLAACS